MVSGVGRPAANPASLHLFQCLQPLPEDIGGHLAGDDASDSDSIHSDTSFLSSGLYSGYLENGRKYQTLREEEYFMPSDDKQFETLEKGHILFRVLDTVINSEKLCVERLKS